MKRVRFAEVGKIVKIKEDPDFDKKGRVEREYKITEVYPHHVVAVNNIGIRRSISYGELVQMGIEGQ